jgi:AcrR family transcriptional regulator
VKKIEDREEIRPRTPAAEKLLRVASELFYREGIRAVGVDTIVERAGVAKMTLYKNFGSKDELAAAYLRARNGRWRGWLEDVVGRADSPRERLLSVFDALGEWMEEDDFRGCASINAAMEIADPDHPARVEAREYKEWMRGYITNLAAEAGAGRPEELAEQVLILFEGATITAAMQTSREPMRRARAAAEALIRDL